MDWHPKFPMSPEDLTEWVSHSVAALDLPDTLSRQPNLEAIQARNLALLMKANTVAAEGFMEVLSPQLQSDLSITDPRSALTAFAKLGEEAGRMHVEACETVRAGVSDALKDLSDR